MPHQLSLSVHLDDSATFDNFYPGELSANTYVIDALKAAEQDLFYLWGNTGAGRSHLLQACCHWFSQQSLYLPLKDFMQENPADVLAGLEHMAVVILDDLNQVVERPDWSEQLFYLYNRIQDKKGVLVVSADRPPTAMETPLADLKSRLSAMHVFKIEALTDGSKAKALIHRAGRRGLDMPENVAQYLLAHYSRDMSDQIRLLDQLDQASLQAQRKLTIPLVREVVQTAGFNEYE